jgi:putative ABC transport system permease protein
VSPTLRLAYRDLRGGLKGLGLLWICLAVAIVGLASVTSLASSVDSAILHPMVANCWAAT